MRRIFKYLFVIIVLFIYLTTFDYFVAFTNNTKDTIKMYEDTHFYSIEYLDKKKKIDEITVYNKFDIEIDMGLGYQSKNLLIGVNYQYGLSPFLKTQKITKKT